MSREMDIDSEWNGALGQMDDLENHAFETESCGICGDIIINRGLLDSCQHCFCYTCIDNWSAITNRCPLCKIEFQHITSTPVYNMTGATTEDEYPLDSGDDDWYMEGESSALSFPSYYIDADAVICLDDSDCKIRSGLVAAEGDSTLDTSIACDSCDKWYHALCVGFNPETATGNSWLCPRCMPTEVKHDADVILKQNFSDKYVIGSDRTSTDATFSGRVSVSIADEGETALVVSMLGIHPEIKSGLSEETFHGTSGSSYSKNDSTHDTVRGASNLRNTHVFSRSQNESSETNIFCAVSSGPAERSLQFSPIRDSNEHLEALKLVSPCSFSDGTFSDKSMETENRGQENAVHKHYMERSVIESPEPSSPARKMKRSHDTVQHMKTPQNMELPYRHDEHKSSDVKEKKGMGSGNEVNRPAKKAKFEMQEQEMNLIKSFTMSSTHGQTTSVSAEATGGDMSELSPQSPSIPDIMSIVEGDDYKRDLGREQAKPVGRRAGDKPGLRVKKIFQKEGNESSVMVQKLQQEIREVVRDTGTNILENDGSFDEKLLTAFRAAIGKSVNGPDKNANLSLIKTKRSLLQKGKKRENLTKKLYGTSTGRRRNTWHRDWEVEFWKYRCPPGVNPEKIETLQSVLQLLKKSSEMDKETARGEKGENSDSIMSRLYLADASVVPRKDGIKPLSALSGCAPLDKSSEIRANNIKSPNKSGVGTETIRISSPGTGKISSSPVLNKEAASLRENRNNHPSQNRKQTSHNTKHDKRKWAQEFLARKQGSSVTSKDQTGDTDALKGKFPLLAQLPADMRPQLQPTAGRNNKVPLSVRQAQLHRIAEHYLQKANLDVIRRCADTELAIADALNVEKDIYDRSNSKLVYVNLCSQAARQPAKAKSDNEASALTEKTESGCDLMSQQVTSDSTKVSGSDMEDAQKRELISDERNELGDDIVPEQTVSKLTFSFSSAEEALKEAGLFDSPPNSPEGKTTELEEGSNRCTVDLDSEPSNILQSSLECRLKDVSSLNDNSVLMSFGKPKANSEEYQKSTPNRATNDTTTSETNAIKLADADKCIVRCERTSGLGKEISVESDMFDEDIGHVDNNKDTAIASNRLPNQSSSGNGWSSEGEVISKPKNLESSSEESSGDNPLLNLKHPKGEDKPTHPTKGGDDSEKPTPEQVKRSKDEVISEPKNSEPSREKPSSDNPSLNMKHPKGEDKPTHPIKGGDDSEKPTPEQVKRSKDKVISKPKNLEFSREKSSGDNPSLNMKQPKGGDKPTHPTKGGDDSEKPTPEQVKRSKDEVISEPKNSEPSREKPSSDNPSLNMKHPKGEDKPTHPIKGGDDSEKPIPEQVKRSKDKVISKPKNLEFSREKSSGDNPSLNMKQPKGGDKPTHPTKGGDDSERPTPEQVKISTSESSSSIYKKVEMFVKEQIRPLCKSGVITVDQYRWSVAKTTDKVMHFHRDAKNANFLIKECDKVKKLALQYVEAAQQKVNS